MHFAEQQQEENNSYFATSKQKHHIKTRSTRTPQSSANTDDPAKFLQFCPHPAVTKITLKFVHLDSDPDLDEKRNGFKLLRHSTLLKNSQEFAATT